ncbi:MAG: nucleotidyltransferase family protein [Myxococcota bacterium]
MIYAESLPAGASLLLTALSQRTEEEDAAWRDSALRFGIVELRALATVNRVERAVGQALGELAGPEWRQDVRDNEARVQALLTLASEASRALQSEGIEGAFFESGGVLCASRLPLAAFGSSDVDLLVRAEQWESALEVLRGLGLAPRQRRSEGVHRAELHVQRGGHDLYLDVARTPFERMTAPLPFEDRSDLWLERRVASSRGAGVCTLHPTDLLVQVAVHTSLHQYILSPGLRLHMDVERLVRDLTIDWPSVVREIEVTGLRTRCFVSFSMAAGLIGASIPHEVLEALAPSGDRGRAVLALIQSQGALDTGERKLGGLQALKLDHLLDDRDMGAWLGGILWPPAAWLRPRMERDGRVPGPDVLLHAARAKSLVKRLLRLG